MNHVDRMSLAAAAEALRMRSRRGAGLNALEQRALFTFSRTSEDRTHMTDEPSVADVASGQRQTREDFVAELKRMREVLGVERGGRLATEAIGLRLPPDPVPAALFIAALHEVDVSKLVEAGIRPAAAWDLDNTIFSGMSPQLIVPFLLGLNPFRQEANAGLVDGMLALDVNWRIAPADLRRRSVAENLALVLEHERSGEVWFLERNRLVAASLEGMTPSQLAAIADRFYCEGTPGLEPPHAENLLGSPEEGTPADVMQALEGKGVRNVIISAGFDFIAAAGARVMGIPAECVFATVLEVSDRGELTGRIAFDVHERGKAELLERSFRPLLIAFGDSPEADGPVMDYSLKGIMVDPGGAFYERNRDMQGEYSVLHFVDPVRRLDPVSFGPLAGKYPNVTGRHRGFYEGATARGVVRIPRRFDPEADLERVVGEFERIFPIAGLHAGSITAPAFLAAVDATIPVAVNHEIDEVLAAARRLAADGVAAPFPEEVAEQHWLTWIMRFAWAHSRDNDRVLRALGYPVAATGRHDFAETMTVGVLMAMLDDRRAKEGKLAPWVENLCERVLATMDAGDEFGIGIANPHLTVSFAYWRPEAQTPAGWFHLTSDHHNGSRAVPVDPIEAGVNDFFHYLREHHFGVLKSTMKSFVDLSWLFDRANASHVAELVKSGLMAEVIADVAPLVERLEKEGIITPWHLLDTRREDVPLYTPRPAAERAAVLPAIETLFAESFNPTYGTRRVLPGQLEAILVNDSEVTFRLCADEQLRDPLGSEVRTRTGVHYLGKYNPRSGELFSFETAAFLLPLAPGLRIANT